MLDPIYSIVTVTLEDRPDAGLRVFSDDLHGLVLSGPDQQAVISAIGPAIAALIKHRVNRDVRVYPARPLHEVLAEPSPRDVQLRVRHEQFVVELASAA